MALTSEQRAALIGLFVNPNLKIKNGVASASSLRTVVRDSKKLLGIKVNKDTVRELILKHYDQKNNRVKKPKELFNTKSKSRRKKTRIHARAIKPALVKKIIKYITKFRGQRRITAKLLKKEFNLTCTNQTIRNAVERSDIRWMRRRAKTYASQRDRDWRLRFCKTLRRWSSAKLKRLVFVDGVTFYWPKSRRQAKNRAKLSLGHLVPRTKKEGLHGDCVGPGTYAKSQGGSLKMWGLHGHHQTLGYGVLRMAPLPPQDRYRTTVTTYTRTGRSRIKPKKNDNSVSMNSARWCEFIKSKLVPWCKSLGFKMDRKSKKKPILIMDKERCLHTKAAYACLRANGFQVLKKFPVASPDLNPIENDWKQIKDHIWDIPKIPASLESRNGFAKRVQNACRRLNNQTEDGVSLLDKIGWMSIKQRCKDCIELHGNRTRW